MIWKDYFNYLYNIGIQEKDAVHMYSFDGVQRGNYFGGESVRRAEVEVRVRKSKDGKVEGKDEVTEEMIKGRGDMVVDWIWKLCNMAFKRDVVLEDWMHSVIVHCTRIKERGPKAGTTEVLPC